MDEFVSVMGVLSPTTFVAIGGVGDAELVEVTIGPGDAHEWVKVLDDGSVVVVPKAGTASMVTKKV
jgi:hypothetical protein